MSSFRPLANFEEIQLKDLPNSINLPKAFIPWFTIAIQANYSDVYLALKDCVKVTDKENDF